MTLTYDQIIEEYERVIANCPDEVKSDKLGYGPPDVFEGHCPGYGRSNGYKKLAKCCNGCSNLAANVFNFKPRYEE